LIHSAEVVTALGVENFIQNEAQAREPAPLKDRPDEARYVMDRVLNEKGAEKITANPVNWRNVVKGGF